MHTAPVLTTRRGPSAGGRDDERGAGEVWKHIDSVLARPAAQQPANFETTDAVGDVDTRRLNLELGVANPANELNP